MNPINTLYRASARLYSAELTAAAHLDTRQLPRCVMLRWCHAGIQPWLPLAVGGTDIIGAALLHAGAVVVEAVLAVTALCFAVSLIAAKSHSILDDDGRPCPYCPAAEDDDGAGGVWLDFGAGIPPAPAPMPELDDRRIGEWAGDADQWLLDLTANTRRATEGGGRQ